MEVKDASPDDVAFFVMDKITLSNWDFPAGRDERRWFPQHVLAKIQEEVGVTPKKRTSTISIYK